ncbi:MAG: tripartite tricarboxylate transporter permease [Vicinamibacterales bacterium]|nr:tripartite tricarboxylate transporter permease [Vicinamibacterales bacterium]
MSALAQLGDNLALGFGAALAPLNLLLGLAGVIMGTAIGVLPGIGPALTISLLLPLTFGMDPVGAFILFGGIYYGAMYGGSTTSILVRMPGEASSVMTALDGYAMTRQGRGGAALATAAIGSFVAGTFATAMLMFMAPALVVVALGFGPTEYFALMMLALTALGGMAGHAPAKGAFSTFLGLAIGTIGIDIQTGQARFTFGIPGLLGGLNVVIVTVGLFAVGEVFWHAAQPRTSSEEPAQLGGPVRLTREDWRRSIPAWCRGTVIGFFTGVLPGAGATVASFLSYAAERRVSSTPEAFGRGAIEGVAGPEAANNASAGGSLVPLLALGIPGSGTTAVMLAAFQMYGLQPGPLLFTQQSGLIWGLIASLYVSNVLLLVLNLPLIRVWVRLLQVPRSLLFAAVLVFATLGVYSLNNSLFDVVVVYVLGVMAFFMRRHGLPLAPTVLGVVLGPLLEQHFRRAMAISGGDPTVFFTRPVSAAILALAVAVLVVPAIVRARVNRY